MKFKKMLQISRNPAIIFPVENFPGLNIRYVSHINGSEWRHGSKTKYFCTLNLTLTLIFTITLTLTLTLTNPNVTLTLT